ncbi:ASCH domain protein, partial [Vibrio cholerae HC-50A2]
ARIMVK